MIRGEGLLLRVPASGDRSRWLELLHEPEQVRYGTPTFVRLPTTVGELDARLVANAEAFATGAPVTFSIVEELEPGHFLGTISWRRDAPEPLRVCEIGYAVHPDARGRGVGQRAIRTLVRWLLLDESGPAQMRVQLDHSVENLPSCRVAVAAGLPQEGVRRAFLPLPDAAAPGGERRHDVCLHGVPVDDL